MIFDDHPRSYPSHPRICALTWLPATTTTDPFALCREPVQEGDPRSAAPLVTQLQAYGRSVGRCSLPARSGRRAGACAASSRSAASAGGRTNSIDIAWPFSSTVTRYDHAADAGEQRAARRWVDRRRIGFAEVADAVLTLRDDRTGRGRRDRRRRRGRSSGRRARRRLDGARCFPGFRAVPHWCAATCPGTLGARCSAATTSRRDACSTVDGRVDHRQGAWWPGRAVTASARRGCTTGGGRRSIRMMPANKARSSGSSTGNAARGSVASTARAQRWTAIEPATAIRSRREVGAAVTIV